MMPILHGESAFVFLAIVVGLGAYVRQVYVDSNEIYDQLKSGALASRWPLEEKFTQDRLANLKYVQTSLIRVTRLMFLLILLLSLRIVAQAINAIPADVAWIFKCARVSEAVLYYWDLALLVYVSVSFGMMWWTHHRGSERERSYHEAMWDYFNKRGPKDSN